MLKSPLTVWDMTVLGSRVFTEVIKLKQGHFDGSKFSLTGIPIKRVIGHRDGAHREKAQEGVHMKTD